MSLSNFSIKKPATTIMIVIAMIYFGFLGLSKMPVDMMPNTSFPMASITVKWDGATPEDVDKMITKKIENVLSSVDGITEYTSTSELEKSQINVYFDYGTDVEVKVILLQNEINQITGDLPEGIDEPEVMEMSNSGTPSIVMMFAGGDSTEMRTYLDASLKPMLEGISGVSEVLLMGGMEQEVLVAVDPEKLENYNLSIEDIVNILAESSVILPGGILLEGEKEFLVKVEGELTTPKEISEVIISNSGGNLLKIKDIADVKMSVKDKDSILRNSGVEGADGLALIVLKTDDSNSIEIASSVKRVAKSMEGSLPMDTKMIVEYDSSITILNAITSVKESAYIGVVLASIILFVFLKSLSATMVVAMSIPTSIIFTFFLLNAMGIGINIITLMGLSLGIGMLVDNSVVVIDNIFRRLTEFKEDKVTAASRGSNEVFLPILASSLTTIAVFIPIIFYKGIVKEQFGDMSYSITFCLIASFIVAVMFVPMMCSKILNKNKNIAHDGRIMKFISEKYIFLLKFVLKKRFLVVTGVVTVFIISIFMAKTLGGGFLPIQDDGRFAVIASLPSGSDINKAEKVADILGERVADVSYSKSYAIMGDQDDVILNINAGAKTSREENMSYILSDLREKFQGLPDVALTVVPGFKGRATDIYDIEFNLYSDNEQKLEVIAEELKERMSKMSELVDVSTSLEGGKPEIKFTIDREKAGYYGVSVQDIASMLNTQVLGSVPLTINSDNDEIDVTVKLKKEYRQSQKLLLDSRITLDNGKNIRISDVANYIVEEGPSKIEKKNNDRKLTLYANLNTGVNLKKAEALIISELNDIGLPDDVTYKSSGDGESMAMIFKQLSTIFISSLFLIYFILVWQFESFVFPFIIIFSVPLSTMGAFFALYFSGKNLDAMVFVGIVMLIGIVVNNAIILIDFINHRIEQGDSIHCAIITSGTTRLRPILMTTLTTILGMVPLAVTSGEGSEMYNGMAFVVIFGLSTASILTLLVVPSIYYIVEEIREKCLLFWKRKTNKYLGLED